MSNSFHRWYDNIIYHNQLIGVGAIQWVVASNYEGIDVSDWDYLVIDAKRWSAAGGANYLGISVTWTDDMNTFAITTGLGVRGQWQSTEWFTLYASGIGSLAEGFWCIPVKGQFVNVAVQSLNANLMFGNLMIGVMRGTRMITRAPSNDLIINYTAPNTVAPNTFRYDTEATAYGKARIHGYVFNSGGAGVTLARLSEIDEAGVGEEILYVQNPPGGPANQVTYFDFIAPLRGRALAFVGQVATGAGNARISVSLFPEL